MRGRGRQWMVALAMSLAGAGATAAATNADDYTRPPAIDDVQPSPSGKRLALLTTSADGRQVLAVLDLPPTKPAHVVGAVQDADVHRYVWVDDDRLVYEAFTPEHIIRAGGAGTLAVDHDGGNVKPLIVWGSEQTQIGTRIATKLLPHSWELLQPLHDGSKDVLVVERRTTVGGEPADSRVARLDTVSGALRPIDAGMPEHVSDWVFDGKGEPVAVQTVFNGRVKLHLREPGSDRWTVIDDHDWFSGSGLSPEYLEGDGQLVVRSNAGRDTAGFYGYDTRQRKLDAEPLARLDRYDVANVESDDALRRVVGVQVLADRPLTSWFSQRLASIQQAVDSALPGRFNTIVCGNCESSAYYVVRSESDRQPGEFFVYDRAKRALTPVGARRPWLDEKTQGTRSFHWFKARDGMPIPLVVTHPAGSKADEPLPAVVVVHGGPWERGADRRWNAEAQFLAAHGWRVLEPDYRGSLGYGARHFAASFKQWGLAMQDDLADAVQWAVGEKLVDARRVCIYGGSYGGYAALMAPARHPDTWRCAASFAGVTDIDLMFSSNRSDFSVQYKRYGMPTVIGDPVADADKLRAASPIRRVADIKVPVLLAQGSLDRRVPREHANAFESAARRAGVAVERVDYGDEGHGWNLYRDHSDFLNRLDRFIARSLAP